MLGFCIIYPIQNISFQKYACHASVRKENDEVIVKNELVDIIKVEDGWEKLWESVPLANPNESEENCDWKEEKSKIIAELITIKQDNQNLRLKLQQQSRLHNTQYTKYSELIHAVKSNDIRNKETIDTLRREKNVLSAQIKQLLLATNAENTTQSENSSEEDYEVDFIRDHKIYKNGIRRFLIRWKNFPPKFDSWEKENNLNCPDILRQYLHLKE